MGQARPVKLRYTSRALWEIDAAIGYLRQRSPSGADNVALRIHQIIGLLTERPLAGAATTRKLTRRFVVNPYPYCIFYRVHKDEIIILRFRHTARKP